MVGFVHSPPGEQESSEPKTQSVSEQGKASDPLVEQLLLDVDDYSLSFTNSFLDFDYLNDWIDPRSDPYSMEAGDSGAVNAGGDFSSNGACEQVEYSEGREKMGSLSCLGPEKSVHGSLDKGVEKDCGGEVKVKEETVVSCGDGKVGELGCLIEEEMGKVNLNGVSSLKEEDGVMDRDMNSVGITEDGGEGIAMNNGNQKGVTSNELVIGEDESSGDSDSGSETESSSSSSSCASSSDDDDDDEEEDEDKDNSNRKGSEMEEGEILARGADDMVAWSPDDDDDDVEESGPKGPIRSKNEVKDLPYVPPVNVTIQPHHQTLPVGNISSIIGAQVIVEGVEKHNPLNEGSILWITESRSPLGIVDEIFGPVKNPYYIVRYNSENDVPVGIQQGTSISFVQEFANHVLNDKNIYKKGYDASGENDEELSEEAEFSDDEKEAEYRRLMKMKKRGTSEQKFGNKTMDKKKVKNRPVNQKQNQAFAPQASTGNVSGNLDQSQQCVPPPFAASGDQRNNVTTGGQAQGSGNGPWSDPALPQLPQFHGYGAPSSGLGMNGIPCQQPQNTGLPSFPAPTQSPGFVPPQQQQRMAFPGVLPAMNMQWPQQSHPHPLFQMPFPNVLPLQQQMNTGQMFPSNFMPGGQPGFNTGSVPLGQGMFNQPPFGLGLHNQNTPLPMNSGQQAVPPNGPQSGSNNDSWTPPDSSWNSNQPRHSHGGRQANRRGGGRFRGGRGRRHNN
ncbi:PREDICTED: H/ACA ribonucleoprotein complex non-core subunit NAF1 [Ipomoea nil]|uniref:H/ACA ribonucleoprotein complex non-core subunit NAF1 n=1 Tax=Ipomoea nil TaxID=35883 RepID=UPI000901EAE8|nr:PREDICTED: H/ACA ribonucleoprotein complex non-core subunit NAF1 [Ipomoea nil]